jgi:heptosyltransferase-2
MDHLGDAILTSGFLVALRAHLPDSLITVFSSEISSQYFARCPYVNQVVSLPSLASVHRDHPQAQDFLRRFFERYGGAFDIAINPRPAPDCFCCALFVGATEAPVRIAFRQNEFVDGLDPNDYYNELVDLPARPEHPAFVARHLLARLSGEAAIIGRPKVWFGRRSATNAESLLGSGRWIAVGVGAAHAYRIWPPENYAAVVNEISPLGYRFVLLGTAEEQGLAERIIAASGDHALDLTGKTSIEDMVAVIQRCVAFVGNDSGPKHIASALGIPTVEIFYISDETPGFEYDRIFVPIDGKGCRISPEGTHSAEATLTGTAIKTIIPKIVIDKLRSLIGA